MVRGRQAGVAPRSGAVPPRQARKCSNQTGTSFGSTHSTCRKPDGSAVASIPSPSPPACPSRATCVTLTGRHVDAVHALLRVVGRDPDRTAEHVGALRVVQHLAHPQRSEPLPPTRPRRSAATCSRRTRPACTRSSSPDRSVTNEFWCCGSITASTKRNVSTVEARGRLVALGVVGLLERRVDVLADHVDVADVVEALRLPDGRDRRPGVRQLGQRVVGLPERVGAREDPAARISAPRPARRAAATAAGPSARPGRPGSSSWSAPPWSSTTVRSRPARQSWSTRRSRAPRGRRGAAGPRDPVFARPRTLQRCSARAERAGSSRRPPDDRGAHMGLRTADEYRASLRDGRTLWYRGKRVDDIVTEPDLRVAVDNACIDFEMTHDDAHRELAVDARRRRPAKSTTRCYALPRTPDDLLAALAAHRDRIAALRDASSRSRTSAPTRCSGCSPRSTGEASSARRRSTAAARPTTSWSPSRRPT